MEDINVLSSVVEEEAITLTVDAADADKIKEAIPTATISVGSKISPSLDIAQDFTLPVEYTIIAEDNITQLTYVVTVDLVKQPKVITFDFSKSTQKYKKQKSENESALPVDQDNFVWDSSDGGVKELIGGFLNATKRFGVTYLNDDINGPAFQLETLQTSSWMPSVPFITSGSLFFGSFVMNMSNPLQSTKFGVIVKEKPLSVSGRLSYKAGKDYYEWKEGDSKNKATLMPDLKDSGLISAIVYEVTAGVATLDGTNINDHPNVVGKTQHILVDGDNGDFSFDIEYTKDFDPAKTYKLALILSASKDGDKFSGAGGSVLTVSKLEVVLE